jgi:type 1 glutamine amidotransferase
MRKQAKTDKWANGKIAEWLHSLFQRFPIFSFGVSPLSCAQFILFVIVLVWAYGLRPQSARANQHQKGRLLYLTLSAGFKHDSVAPSRNIVKGIGEKSGAFDTTLADDVVGLTAETLKNYDAVMFYTTGELPMTAEQKSALVDFIKSGHGFVGVHSATDTFYMWSDYVDIVGAYFNDHPWHQQVTVDVADPESPLVKFLGKSFQVNDEIYQMSDFQAKTSHVLLKLDTSSVDMKKPGVRQRFYGYPLAWTRSVGEGRTFYTALGHEEAVWKSDWFQQLLLNGIRWAMGSRM